MKGPKFYVVWEGHNPGIYTTWDECKKQVVGYPNAKYKSYPSMTEAEFAFHEGYYEAKKKEANTVIPEAGVAKPPVSMPFAPYTTDAIAVDASCLGNPGKMEYRGVYVKTGQELFRIGPFDDGTNNIGEFLAIVHALALLKKKGSELVVYTDSVNAMKWVRYKKCKTTLEKTPRNGVIFELIERAEKWLNENYYSNKIIKWDTKGWGEIPADFGRK